MASAHLTGLLNFVFPAKCALCEAIEADSPCSDCVAEMRSVGTPTFELGDLSGASAAYAYGGRAGMAVRALKFQRCTSLVPFMAAEVARVGSGIAFDVVVPVPIHFLRWSLRGFNQSELLCEAFAADVKPSWLRRVRSTSPQVGLTAVARRENLTDAFSAAPEVAGRRVLLVDDVVTTGSTARECARTLKRAGALSVHLVTFAAED